MAKDTSLEGIRSAILHSFYGRKLGYSKAEFLAGPKDIRLPVTGISSAGSTLVSTGSYNTINNHGVVLIGSSGASGTTDNAYLLDQPEPGIRMTLFNPTTGYALVATSTALSTGGPSVGGAYLCSTGSVTSTQQLMAFYGKGSFVDLIGLTTNLWGVVGLPAGFTTGATTAVSIS